MANIFRKTSLDRLSSPEQLDKLITVTSPRVWLIIITIGVVLTCAIIWGIFGKIPVRVDTSGILLSSGGMSNVTATVNGAITDVNVQNGDTLSKGDVIAIIGEGDVVRQMNDKKEAIAVLETLTANSNWDTVDLPADLLDIQQLGQQINKAGAAAGYAGVDPQIAKNEYEAYKKLYEAGAASKAELDAKYSTYMDAQSNYAVQSLTANQARAQFDVTKQAKLDQLKKELEELQSSVRTQYTIVAPEDCKVVEVKVSKGDVVSAGTDIANVAKTGSDVKALEAVIYVPVSNGKKIKEGMSVKIYPSTVSKEEYGYMKGTVTEVPEYPVSPESVLDTLGNQSLAQQLTGEGSPLEVRVDLVADETTVSGYAWSSKKGAGVNVQNGTLCSAAVVVDEQSPASMVIPLLKKKILPFE
jgi:HlyD family secretion protein